MQSVFSFGNLVSIGFINFLLLVKKEKAVLSDAEWIYYD